MRVQVNLDWLYDYSVCEYLAKGEENYNDILKRKYTFLDNNQ